MSTQRQRINSTHHSSLVNVAINLNNQGVRQTIAGNDKAAVTMFSKALAAFQGVIAQTRRNGLNSINKMSTLSFQKSTELNRLPNFPKGFSVFDKLISFAPIEEEYIAADLLACCSAILFNTALVYHRQAIVGHQYDLLSKAERIYNRILGLVPDISSRGSKRRVNNFGAGVRRAALFNIRQIFATIGKENQQNFMNGLEATASKDNTLSLAAAA